MADGVTRERRKVDAVFEGGGVRGIGLVGAAAVVEEAGYTFNNVAGTSAGAIIASLLAAGYSAGELTEIMREVDYTRFRDGSALERVPGIGPLANVLLEDGLYAGDYLEGWVREHLARMGVRTFGDLVMPGEKNPKYRHRLQVVASDLTTGKMLLLPRDIALFGMNPDDLEVARAVRMSMSIPFFYEPVRLADADGDVHYIVDGGLLSNFPVWIFDDGTTRPPWPTFGFRLVRGDGDERARPRNEVTGIVSFLEATVRTMLEAHDEKHVEDAHWARTIPIPTGDVGTTEFGLTPARRDALYQSGRDAARGFLEEWSFDRYVEDFRGRTPKSRGERLRRAG